MDKRFTVLDVLKDKHREIERLFEKLSSEGENITEQSANLARVILQLLSAVERHLYPVVRNPHAKRRCRA